jgi:hypothetical protein
MNMKKHFLSGFSICLFIWVGCASPSIFREGGDYYYFGRPAARWCVQIPKSQYTVLWYQNINPGAQGRIDVGIPDHPRTKITFSLQQDKGFGSAAAYRVAQRMRGAGGTYTSYEKDSIACLERKDDDVRTAGLLVTGYYVRDNDVLTISIYTNQFQENEDRQLITELFDSIKFIPRESIE